MGMVMAGVGAARTVWEVVAEKVGRGEWRTRAEGVEYAWARRKSWKHKAQRGAAWRRGTKMSEPSSNDITANCPCNKK